MKPYNEMTVSEKLNLKRVSIRHSMFDNARQIKAQEKLKERLEDNGYILAESNNLHSLYVKEK